MASNTQKQDGWHIEASRDGVIWQGIGVFAPTAPEAECLCRNWSHVVRTHDFRVVPYIKGAK